MPRAVSVLESGEASSERVHRLKNISVRSGQRYATIRDEMGSFGSHELHGPAGWCVCQLGEAFKSLVSDLIKRCIISATTICAREEVIRTEKGPKIGFEELVAVWYSVVLLRFDLHQPRKAVRRSHTPQNHKENY